MNWPIKILAAGSIPAVRHQPAGRMCCSCKHLGSAVCAGLDFASMPVLHMYSDGTAAVRCKAHARGESAVVAPAPAVVAPALSVRMFAAAKSHPSQWVRGELREFAAEVELLEIAAGATTP